MAASMMIAMLSTSGPRSPRKSFALPTQMPSMSRPFSLLGKSTNGSIYSLRRRTPRKLRGPLNGKAVTGSTSPSPFFSSVAEPRRWRLTRSLKRWSSVRAFLGCLRTRQCEPQIQSFPFATSSDSEIRFVGILLARKVCKELSQGNLLPQAKAILCRFETFNRAALIGGRPKKATRRHEGGEAGQKLLVLLRRLTIGEPDGGIRSKLAKFHGAYRAGAAESQTILPPTMVITDWMSLI